VLFLTKKQLAIGALLFCVGLTAPFGIALFAKAIYPQSPSTTTFMSPTTKTTPLPISQSAFSILLLGHGGDGHPGGNLADAIQIAYINPEQKKVALIAIPRDLWVPMKGGHYKINHAFDLGNTHENPHGGGQLTMDVLSNVTSLPIDYYVSVNFEGFKQSINLLGGITVDVPVTFDEYYYPIPGEEANICGKSPTEMVRIHKLYSGFELESQFKCRYEHLHFEAGPMEMDGNLALKFIRSRHSTEHGGDFARGQRQQALLIAVIKEVISLDNLDKAIPFANKFSFAIRTNINEDALLDLLKLAGHPKDYETININVDDNLLEFSTSSDGQSILIPKAGLDNWSAIRAFVHERL